MGMWNVGKEKIRGCTIIFIYLKVCLCVYDFVLARVGGGQKTVSDSLELQAVVRLMWWVLKTKFWSSAWSACALKYRAISPGAHMGSTWKTP